MGYDFQPGESIPLSYNSYQAVFPTLILITEATPVAQTLERKVVRVSVCPQQSHPKYNLWAKRWPIQNFLRK